MKNEIIPMIDESIKVKKDVANKLVPHIEKAAKIIVEAFRSNRKLLLAGNGGSAAQASHLAAEFVGRYKISRKALPAIALTSEQSLLTAWSNDYEYETVFQRQLQAFAQPSDVFIAISTSGNSANIIKAIEEAKKLKMRTISFLGKGGGKMKGLSDIEIIIPSDNTPVIQENHLMIFHIICELVDGELFGG